MLNTVDTAYVSDSKIELLLEGPESKEYAQVLAVAYFEFLRRFLDQEVQIISLPRGADRAIDVANWLELQNISVVDKKIQKLIRAQVDAHGTSVLSHDFVPEFNIEPTQTILIPESTVKTGATIAAVVAQLLMRLPEGQTMDVYVYAPTMMREGYEKVLKMDSELAAANKGHIYAFTDHIIVDPEYTGPDHGDRHEALGEKGLFTRDLLGERLVN